MYTTNLRKVGGSVMLSIPPALLEVVNFDVNNEVGITVHNGRLIVESKQHRRYSLQSLIDQCDPSVPLPPADPEWLDMPPPEPKFVEGQRHLPPRSRPRQRT